MARSELERRLREWADEYAGGRYPYFGWMRTSTIATLMTYHGRAPDGLHPRPLIGTAADQVEDAVQAMAKRPGGVLHMAVLRTDYWMRSAALEHKLQRLREVDQLRLTADVYAQILQRARHFVAQHLGLADDSPFGEARCAR